MKLRMVLHQWIKNFGLSVFITIQLAVVFLLAVASGSTISSQSKYYTAFADYF